MNHPSPQHSYAGLQPLSASSQLPLDSFTSRRKVLGTHSLHIDVQKGSEHTHCLQEP